MNLDVNGKVRHISKENIVEGLNATHKFKIIVIETLFDSYVAIHVWNDKLEILETIKVGDIVDLNCRLESIKNKKNPGLWFHKILIR